MPFIFNRWSRRAKEIIVTGQRSKGAKPNGKSNPQIKARKYFFTDY